MLRSCAIVFTGQLRSTYIHVHILFQILYDNSADVNAVSKYRRTALLEATCNASENDRYYSSVCWLLDHRADVDQADILGYTPVMRACMRNSLKSAQALIKAGASILRSDPTIGRNDDTSLPDLGLLTSCCFKVSHVSQNSIKHFIFKKYSEI